MKDAKEYSKKIINLMIVMWFAGAIYGAIIIAVEIIATLALVDGFSMAITIHLPEWLAYLGTPIGGGIVGYLIKSALENKEKIRKSHEDVHTEDIP